MIHVIAGPNKPSGMVMTLPARYSIALLCCLFVNRGIVRGEPGGPTTLRFAVTVAPGSDQTGPVSGRLLVVLGRPDGGEPRLTVGRTGMDAAPILARDVATLAPGKQAVLDDRSIIFPIEHLGDLRPGAYAVQAILHTNPDLNFPNAPGDLYSPVRKVRLDPAAGGTVALELSRAIPDGDSPPDTELVKYVKIRSSLSSEFHGRPIFLRAGVILPATSPASPTGAIPCGSTSAATAPGSPGGRADGRGICVPRPLDGRRHSADDLRRGSTAPGRWAIPTRSTRPTTAPTATRSRGS